MCTRKINDNLDQVVKQLNLVEGDIVHYRLLSCRRNGFRKGYATYMIPSSQGP